MLFIKTVINFIPNWEMQAQSTVTHTHTHTHTHVLLVLRDIHSIISPTACLSMAYILPLFKNILYTTHVYFVMSIVSA
jgi:hypothetical protein